MAKRILELQNIFIRGKKNLLACLSYKTYVPILALIVAIITPCYWRTLEPSFWTLEVSRGVGRNFRLDPFLRIRTGYMVSGNTAPKYLNLSIRKLPKHVREAQLKAGIKELDCLIARKQVSADWARAVDCRVHCMCNQHDFAMGQSRGGLTPSISPSTSYTKSTPPPPPPHHGVGHQVHTPSYTPTMGWGTKSTPPPILPPWGGAPSPHPLLYFHHGVGHQVHTPSYTPTMGWGTKSTPPPIFPPYGPPSPHLLLLPLWLRIKFTPPPSDLLNWQLLVSI